MNAVILSLDAVRSAILRVTMKSRIVRSLFVDRAVRLGVSFAASFFVNLILAAVVPVWVVVLGPLFFGIWHLLSGIRYLPKLMGEEIETTFARRLRSAGTLLIFAVALIRFFSLPNTGLFNSWELGAAVVLTVLVWRRRTPIASSCILLAAVATLSWISPLLTVGLLAIGHNFFAFVFWFRLAQSEKERKLVLMAFLFTVLGSALFFTNILSPLVNLSAWVSDPTGASLATYALAHQIFPLNTDFDFMLRILSAFAFGQSMHYFVWLKAIPEQALSHQTPVNFRQSWFAWTRELGVPTMAIGVSLGAASIFGVFFMNLEMLRSFYLAAASAHGYLELSALPLALAGSVRGRS